MAIKRHKGRILPGEVLNPKGRPKNPDSITAWLRKWATYKGADGVEYRERLVKILWLEAMSGNMRAAELIINRTDGLLTQQIHQLSRVEIVEVSDEEWAGTEPVDAETSAVPNGSEPEAG